MRNICSDLTIPFGVRITSMLALRSIFYKYREGKNGFMKTTDMSQLAPPHHISPPSHFPVLNKCCRPGTERFLRSRLVIRQFMLPLRINAPGVKVYCVFCSGVHTSTIHWETQRDNANRCLRIVYMYSVPGTSRTAGLLLVNIAYPCYRL